MIGERYIIDSIRVIMQLLKQWRGEGSRKRAAADDSSQGSLRKRIKDDDHGRCESVGTGMEGGTGDGLERDQEYRIRGISTINKDSFHSSSLSPFPNQSASSSLVPESMRSSPPVHPDRRDNIINTASASASTPAPAPAPDSASTSLIKTQSPRSPLSQASEHINKVVLEDERRM